MTRTRRKCHLSAARQAGLCSGGDEGLPAERLGESQGQAEAEWLAALTSLVARSNLQHSQLGEEITRSL